MTVGFRAAAEYQHVPGEEAENEYDTFTAERLGILVSTDAVRSDSELVHKIAELLGIRRQD